MGKIIAEIPLEEALEFAKLDKAQSFGEMLQKSLCDRKQLDPLSFMENMPKEIMQKYRVHLSVDDYGPYILNKWFDAQMQNLSLPPIQDATLNYEWIGTVYAYAFIQYDMFLSSREDIEQICKTCDMAKYDMADFPDADAVIAAVNRIIQYQTEKMISDMED